MAVCAVATCDNYYRKTKGRGLIYHSFPKEPRVVKEWVRRCKRKDTLNVTTAKICAEHFNPEDYKDDLMHRLLGLPEKKFLKSDALPSKLLPLQREDDPVKVKQSNERLQRLQKRMKNKNLRKIYNVTREAKVDLPNGSFSTACGNFNKADIEVLKKADGLGASVPTDLDHNLFASTTSPSSVVSVVNRVVEVNTTPFTTPDIPEPLFESGPSNRVEPDSSMGDNLTAVPCEKFPVSEESKFVAVKIKQEPPDPFDILSANVEGKLNRFSEAPPSANSNVGSLFEPPALIKDEIVSSEEDL